MDWNGQILNTMDLIGISPNLRVGLCNLPKKLLLCIDSVSTHTIHDINHGLRIIWK